MPSPIGCACATSAWPWISDFGARAVRATARLRFDRPDPAAPLVLDTNGLAIAAVTGLDGKPRAYQLGADGQGAGRAADHHAVARRHRGEDRLPHHRTSPRRCSGWRRSRPAIASSRSCSPRASRSSPAAGSRCRTRPASASPTTPPCARPTGLTAGDERRAAGPRRRRRLALPHGRADPAVPHRAGLRATSPSRPSPTAPACGPSRRWSRPRARSSPTPRSMIRAAESLFGPYRWGRYDLIILPPSFPFGGMENPRLTFATPTILAGDKSLVVAGGPRAGALLVGQPGHQRHLARLLAERGLHHLLRAADHGAGVSGPSARAWRSSCP